MFDQSRIVDGSVYAAIRARAKSIHVPSSCFGFQALNPGIGKHDLVQIAIGMAEGQFVIRVAVARRQPCARLSGDCAHLTSHVRISDALIRFFGRTRALTTLLTPSNRDAAEFDAWLTQD